MNSNPKRALAVYGATCKVAREKTRIVRTEVGDTRSESMPPWAVDKVSVAHVTNRTLIPSANTRRIMDTSPTGHGPGFYGRTGETKIDRKNCVAPLPGTGQDPPSSY